MAAPLRLKQGEHNYHNKIKVGVAARGAGRAMEMVNRTRCSWGKMDGQPVRCCTNYPTKRNQEWMIKCLQAAAQIKKSHDCLPGFWTWASSRFPEQLKEKSDPPHTHTQKNTGIPQQVYSITLPVLPQSDLQPFTYLIIQ